MVHTFTQLWRRGLDWAGRNPRYSAVVKLLIETAHALVNLKDKGMLATDETPDHTCARGPATRGGEEKPRLSLAPRLGGERRRGNGDNAFISRRLLVIYSLRPIGTRDPRPRRSSSVC